MKAEQRSGRRVGRIILLVGLAAIAVFIVVGVFTTINWSQKSKSRPVLLSSGSI
jgi:cytochrome c-type biogenesis protein CcmH/NrfG